MNILYVATHPLLPVNTGARLRDFQLARQLASRASVTFVEMRPPEEPVAGLPEETAFMEVVTLRRSASYTLPALLLGIIGPKPITVWNCWSTESASRIAELLRRSQFDSIQMEGIHLTNYLNILQRASGLSPIVVDWHNIESELMWRYAALTRNLPKRLVARRTARLLERTEEDLLLRADLTHTVPSERERLKLLAKYPQARIEVIPNGVELAAFAFGQGPSVEASPTSKLSLLFVGSMDYHANIDAVIWFSEKVWPEIAKSCPDLRFQVVGRNPAASVRALRSERIEITGTVEDVRPYYKSALAAVVPLRSGGGTRLKILEAMAAGVPVISTRQGSEGLDAEHGVHLLLADEPGDILAAVRCLAASPETRNRLCEAARELVRSKYDWSSIGERLYQVHNRQKLGVKSAESSRYSK